MHVTRVMIFYFYFFIILRFMDYRSDDNIYIFHRRFIINVIANKTLYYIRP